MKTGVRRAAVRGEGRHMAVLRAAVRAVAACGLAESGHAAVPLYKSVLKIFSFRKILSFLENRAKNKAAEAAKEEGGALTAHSFIRAVGKSAGVY